MKKNPFRHIATFVVLCAGVWWAMASATTQAARGDEYPAGEILVDAQWLMEHIDEPNLIVVDVREDKYFDGKLIAGAVRLPYGEFRQDDTALGIGDNFVGTTEAQKLLGQAGISRPDELVLYDSVARDGGATASYVYWVLDLLGHEKIRILERGIDAWVDAGGQLATEPRVLGPSMYQALSEEIDLRKMADGAFVYSRLGDPFYQVLDVRSREEYLGEKANKALAGGPLKLGHIPTAVNIDYTDNWADPETKKFKSYEQLRELYRGLDSSKAVVAYCHSARRSSFTYFVLKLMGFSHVIVYEPSWYEWGSYSKFFPVELSENKLAGGELPQASRTVNASVKKETAAPPQGKDAASKGGYVSCGG